jgi:RNA polymerase sigma-70 factor (ECF subfamily)
MSELVAEKALVDAAIAGDVSAVERLLWDYYSPLQRHVEPKIPRHAHRHFGVEDILQLVFSQAFHDIGRFEPRGDGSFFAWLRTIADHRLIDTLRKIDRGDAKQLSLAHFGNTSSLADLLDVVCHDSASPSKHARGQEAIRAIQIAIASLPADQQEAIRLHCLEQKSTEEIARETGRTEAAIRGLVHRGKKNLAEAMGRSSRWLSSG